MLSYIGEHMQSEFDNPRLSSPNLLLGQALDQLRSALQLLDDAHAPGDIGAHIDLAVSRLEDLLK